METTAGTSSTVQSQQVLFSPSCSSFAPAAASGSCAWLDAAPGPSKVCRPGEVEGSGSAEAPPIRGPCCRSILTVLECGVNRGVRLHGAQRDVGLLGSGSQVHGVALESREVNKEQERRRRQWKISHFQFYTCLKKHVEQTGAD